MRRSLLLAFKESLNNLLKYANATQAIIEMSFNNHQLKIIISDDGVGIDKSKSNEFGNGLKNMKKRIEDIRGNFQILSSPGTSIVFTAPLNS